MLGYYKLRNDKNGGPENQIPLDNVKYIDEKNKQARLRQTMLGYPYNNEMLF